MKSPDRRLVENFINYSINDLRNPVRASSLDSVVLMHAVGTRSPSYYTNESETKYLQVPIYTKIAKPQRTGGGYQQQGVSSSPAYDPLYQTPTPYPYSNWQETPLIFPYGDQKPPSTRPPFVSSGYYPPEEYAGHRPAFVTPVEHQASPVFITPVQSYQGPTFVTPISVAQTQLSDGNRPPAIVILEDIDPETEPPQSDPVVEQDPSVAGEAGEGAGEAGGGAGSGGLAGAAAATGAAAAVLGAGAGIVGITGGAATAVALGGLAGGAGGTGAGGTGAGGGLGGITGALQPAQEIQCRSGASKVCSELITVPSSPASSSGPSSLLDGLITFFSALNLVGPLSLIFWSMLFPPMSIILASGLGVLSFMFPFLLPRMWFGRQLGRDISTNRFDSRFDHVTNHPRRRPYY